MAEWATVVWRRARREERSSGGRGGEAAREMGREGSDL